MNKSATIETPENEIKRDGSTIAELKVSIAQYLTEIDQMRELMSQDQAEIDRSRRRTYALLADIKATVSPSSQKAA